MANDVRIRATVNDQVSGPLGRIKDKFDTLGKSGGFKSVAQGVGMGAGIAAWNQLGNVASVAVDVIKDSIQAASDQREAMSLNQQVFRSTSDVIDDWSDTTAEAFGQSKTEAINFASTFGNTMKAAGLDADALAEKSMELTRRAADLGSAFNASGEEVATALRSGLVGETEPLRRFGILLNAASVEAKALKMGLAGSKKEISEGDKVLARYAIIMEQSRDSAGMFGRDVDSLADKQKILNARWEDAQAELGTKLLPAVTDAAEALLDMGDALANLDTKLPAIDSSLIDIAANLKGVADAGTTPLLHLSDLFEVAADAVDALGISTDNARGIFRDFGIDVEDGADHSMDAVESMRGNIGSSLSGTSDHFDQFADDADDATESVAKSFDDMVDALRGDAQSLIDDFFDPIETRADIYQSREEQRAAEERLRDAKTAAAKREATDDIIGAISDQADSLVDLSERGKLTSRDIDNFEKNVKKSYDVLGKEVPADIARIIAKLRELDKWDGHTINVYTKYTTTTGTGSDGRRGHRATGGPVKADEAYIVGESGRELFVPNEDGHIIPNSRIDSGIGPLGLSSQPVIVFNFNGLTYPPSPAQQQEMARTLGPALRDYLNRRG